VANSYPALVTALANTVDDGQTLLRNRVRPVLLDLAAEFNELIDQPHSAPAWHEMLFRVPAVALAHGLFRKSPEGLGLIRKVTERGGLLPKVAKCGELEAARQFTMQVFAHLAPHLVHEASGRYVQCAVGDEVSRLANLDEHELHLLFSRAYWALPEIEVFGDVDPVADERIDDAIQHLLGDSIDTSRDLLDTESEPALVGASPLEANPPLRTIRPSTRGDPGTDDAAGCQPPSSEAEFVLRLVEFACECESACTRLMAHRPMSALGAGYAPTGALIGEILAYVPDQVRTARGALLSAAEIAAMLDDFGRTDPWELWSVLDHPDRFAVELLQATIAARITIHLGVALKSA
jgi:hypothetical protein